MFWYFKAQACHLQICKTYFHRLLMKTLSELSEPMNHQYTDSRERNYIL